MAYSEGGAQDTSLIASTNTSPLQFNGSAANATWVRYGRIWLSVIVAVTSAPYLHAGFVHFWSVQELQKAPLLAVATVESVDKMQPVPPELVRSNTPARYWEATLRVHRSYPRTTLGLNTQITVRYRSYADAEAGGINGPIWPRFDVGQTAVFPLSLSESGMWRLVADEGVNLTVPAIITPARAPEGSPPSARAFLLSELANTLAHGDTPSRYAAATFLDPPQAWPDGFRAALERAVGASDDRWLEVACALLASLGIPHPTIAELMANPNLPGAGNQAIAWALAKGAKRDYPNRLIRCFLRNMPDYDWGAANELLEFKDSPLVIGRMKDLLSRDPTGSIYVAWVLVRNGQHVILPEALQAAIKLVSAPARVRMNRLQASSALLRDFGSESQFAVIPATLRRLKYKDEDAYRMLFSSVSDPQSQREMQIAAVLIHDRRPGFGTLRYCDVAAGLVHMLSGQSFGFQQEMTLEERDRVVARASAWLRSHLELDQMGSHRKNN